MHYDTAANNHGLRFNPFKAIVVPRPIGWIGTVSKDGVPNLAPYSFFNAMSDRPPVVVSPLQATRIPCAMWKRPVNSPARSPHGICATR